MTSPTGARKQLRAHALKHPEAWAEEPWPGDHVAKSEEEIFIFLGGEGPDVSVGVKLPRSLLFARAQKFVENMVYGVDKSGVVARFSKDDELPLDLLRSWIDESYETVAATALPKRKPACWRSRGRHLSCAGTGSSTSRRLPRLDGML
jgi:predicted DNA-binding protein (MmcQ/YjbR family)